MSALPSKFQSKGGTYFSAKAAATITQCYALMLDDDGEFALATADNLISGIASNDYVTGDVVACHRGGHSVVALTGTAVAGDYVEVSATPGVLQADGTSGSTAVSLGTVGKLTSDKDADGLAWCDFSMGR